MGNITEKLNYLNQTKQEIKQALIDKGATVNDTDTFRSYAEKISTIETGIDTSDGTAVSSDILEGKVAYSQDQRIVGTLKMASDYNAKIGKIKSGYDVRSAITEITEIDVSNSTNLDSAFYSCAIKTVPPINTSHVKSMKQTFSMCTELEEISQLDTSKITTAEGMFIKCQKLNKLPELSLNACTKTVQMFENCTSLKEVNIKNMGSVSMLYYMFRHCSALETIGELDLSGATNISDMFTNCTALKNLGGFKNLGKAYTGSANYNAHKLNLSNCTNLTHDSLMNVINGLYTVTNTQQLVLGATNLAKLTSDEIAIATSKNWTVS